MKKNSSTIILVLFFFIGLCILLYPAVSNFYNKKYQSTAIVDYDNITKSYNSDEYKKIFADADWYNDEIRKLNNPFYTHQTINKYHDILNIDGNGMIGYITISKIKVKLPIYHGTDEKVLSKGVGHLEGTSLPVGGSATHSVLSAHRGLPSSTLFTNLNKMEIGDTFLISVLDKELLYEVDQILIVEPEDVEELLINDNADYVTLITCTPYGINTHRMLVRGKRIDNNIIKTYVSTEAFKISNNVVTIAITSIISFILLLILIIKPTNKKVYKDKYLYPSKYKENQEGIKNDK